ncbi:TPA: MFS transporter [Legionella pneumophila subsp. pneumophila]|nr:MFS transporter [Legionella pneumophila]HAT9245285.1 MFS transporter [Legionella pneumophila subsp. pneumophila]HCC0378631.1 MFS transporter [Legionella pneumophila]HCE5643564.1 MFS transporter [Legionella pneumophila]HCE5646748.1 MFS transporter [Legionella pneumophila]
MKYSWNKTVFPIAAIFSFRLLGLFLLIPVFTLYATNLKGATPTLIGLALGSYGLAQGLLQIPFGMLSDKLGRKPMIAIGLLLFAGGSLLGAVTHSIAGMITARILQGAGAIGSVLIALLADLTLDEQRTKAMAIVGITIGTSFSLAMIISPALTHYYGLSGVFYLTAALAVLGIMILYLIIPNPSKEQFHADSEPSLSLIKPVVTDQHLQRLNFGIFCQHFILTATFFAIPMLLKYQIETGHLHQQWHFYLPLMLFSFILMVPFIIISERKKRLKTVFVISVLLTTFTQGLLMFTSQNWYWFCILMFVYFVSFNVLEATLPSLVSKLASPGSKGTAMGIYSTSQFLGIFFGGSLAGILYQWYDNQAIFLINMILSCLWLIISLSMKSNVYFSTLILPFTANNEESKLVVNQLLKVTGIKEVILSKDENTLYVRVDNEEYSTGSAEKILHQSTIYQ